MPEWRSLSAFNSELGKLEKAFDAAEKRKITKAQAEAGQKIADHYAARDLGGDRAFSGWTRGKPIVADLQVKPTTSNGHLLMPANRGSAGVWTVADQGRHQGNARGFQGPGVNRRTGATTRTKSGALRKVRATKARQWNGVTRGKGTAGDAVRTIDAVTPRFAEDGYRRILRKHFDVTGD